MNETFTRSTKRGIVKSNLYLFQGFFNVQEKFNIPIHAWGRLKIKSSPERITECTVRHFIWDAKENLLIHDRKKKIKNIITIAIQIWFKIF